MADVMTKEQRSRCMSRIRSKDTTPEREVRRVLTLLGYRYRLHPKNVPGRPDVVIRRLKLAIFVHGCFWHRHECKLGRATPKTNADFWAKKFAANQERDRTVLESLTQNGWRVVTLWECEIEARSIQKRLLSELKRQDKTKVRPNPL